MFTRTPNRFVSMLTTASALGSGLLFSSVALASNYEVCLDIQVFNNDSEHTTPTGITEDHWWSSSPQTVFPARGFYVKVLVSGETVALGYSDSDTGCFAFTHPAPSSLGVQIQVLSQARHGTSYVRVHDGGSSTVSSAPGSLLPPVVFNETIWPNVTEDVVIPIDGDWNVLATASYALWRVRTGLDDTVISIGLDDEMSSASYGSSSSWIDYGAYLIRINNNPGGGGSNYDARWVKFEVVHEMGHAAARLNYGVDGLEDDYDTGYVYGGSDTNGCFTESSYNLRTVEYDSVPFKEGFAHLYAARVFNNKADDGALTILGTTISLEAYQSGSNSTGGHLRNHCDATPDHGTSTCEDWARFLWDIYTIPTGTCGSPQIGLDEMYDIYSATRAMNPTAVDAWHADIINAINANGTLSACEKSQAEDFANWNAIGGITHAY